MSCSSSSGSEEDEGVDAYRKGGYHAVRPGDPFAGGRYIAQKKLGWGNFSTVWLAYDMRCEVGLLLLLNHMQFKWLLVEGKCRSANPRGLLMWFSHDLFFVPNAKFVALKIQKSAADFSQAALHEIEMLSAITKGDPSNCKCVVHLLDNFKHIGPNGQHPCMVFENLGDSLLRLIRYSRYKGIGIKNVKLVCRSILLGLDYLHRDLGIIHADLKPENILLVSTIDPSKHPTRSTFTPILERQEGSINGTSVVNNIEKRLKERAKRARVRISRRASLGGGGQAVVQKERSFEGIDLRCKIVDFGNACWADKKIADEIQTRHYRAPEVILGAGYSFPTDIWSFGCIAFELATGDMLFSPKPGQGFTEDEDHLALMMELLGKIPRKVASTGSRSKDYFDRYGDLKRIRRLKFWPMDRLLVEKYKFSELDARELSDFLQPILDFAPEKRPTASQCLQHPWLSISDPGSKIKSDQAGVGNLEVSMGKLQVRSGNK